ncbi:MAG: Hpt domain-containing protein [Ferruginibacter sp.]|nr:Hpt domain-containing protein [Cytophagales bacterium]
MKIQNGSERQFNLDHLYELAAGDQGFIREMIEFYLSQVPGVIREMRQLRESKEWRELGEVAHKAKSSFKFMGMLQLTEDARGLEEICRHPQPDEGTIGTLVASIETLTAISSEELRVELSKS